MADSTHSDGGFEPVLAFDTDEPEFARGFEAGRLWTLLQSDPDSLIGQPIHATNTEMVLRMLDALGGIEGVHADIVSHDWLVLLRG